jgi:glycosyltransferase involved in cell wall biosynthesis
MKLHPFLWNISNKEVRKLLTDADILLDELYMHGPGMIGIEAMASGCCVVAKYLEGSPLCFRIFLHKSQLPSRM